MRFEITPILGAIVAGVVAGNLLMASPVRADMSASEVSQAQAQVTSALAAAAKVTAGERASYAAAAAARQGGDETSQCFNKRGGRRITELSADELRAVRGCLAGALEKVAGQIEKLKAMQENRMFDTAVFAESVRLLSTPDVGAEAAMAPVAKMLAAAKTAQATHSQRLLIRRLEQLTGDITGRLSGGGGA